MVAMKTIGILQLRAAAVLAAAFCLAGAANAQKSSTQRQDGHTYCNPMDLDYRFSLEKPSRREAADPTMVVFHGEYWLFASKSGGYWESKDMHTWKHIWAEGYPVETYAPTVVEIGGKLYLSAFNDPYLYVTDDPADGAVAQGCVDSAVCRSRFVCGQGSQAVCIRGLLEHRSTAGDGA